VSPHKEAAALLLDDHRMAVDLHHMADRCLTRGYPTLHLTTVSGRLEVPAPGEEILPGA